MRPAVEADLEMLNNIYNGYVKETHYTFDLEPMTIEARREWFTHYGPTGRYRLLVAVADATVIGYASSSRLRPRREGTRRHRRGMFTSCSPIASFRSSN